MCLTDYCCLAATCICQTCVGSSPTAARYVYGLLFLLTNIMAWMVRDYSHKRYIPFHYLKGCQTGLDCMGSDGVLRLSFGCFMFFFFMFLTTARTSNTKDIRDAWHVGWWPVKLTMWAALLVVPFLIPPQYIAIYGEVGRFGAGIFLLIQLVSFINFIYFWNEEWLKEKYKRTCHIPMILISALSFIASLFTIGIMIIWFIPNGCCKLNIFFISSTLILVMLITTISMSSKVNAGLLTSSLMAIYIVFLIWCAIMSEPISLSCNTRPCPNGSKFDWLTIVEFLVGVCAIVIATFTTGMDSRSFSIPQKDDYGGQKVPYNYGFFHFVFAIGAMYFAMLFVGWNSHQIMHKWSIDIGWASVWIKIANVWVAASLYVWSMIGPLILQNREFS